MTGEPRTAGEKTIERLMTELEPGTERFEVLACARRFKSSWVELGERLTRVDGHGRWKEWGYLSFEEYCAREVRIRKLTAEKLTRAYRFLEREEPQVIAQRAELKPPPDFRSVDLLRQAREDDRFPDATYGELRRSVLEEERSHPTILKRYRDLAPAPPSDAVLPVKGALAALRRLRTALEGVPALPGALLAPLAALEDHLVGRLPGEGDG